MKFKLDQYVVYPGHGVGVIEAIITRNILGLNHDFYNIKMLYSEMRINVPVKNSSAVGLRAVIKKADAHKVLKILTSKSDIDNQTWVRRNREYLKKIGSGDVYQIAEVFRDLKQLNIEKELTFGERKVLDNVYTLLGYELREALGELSLEFQIFLKLLNN